MLVCAGAWVAWAEVADIALPLLFSRLPGRRLDAENPAVGFTEGPDALLPQSALDAGCRDTGRVGDGLYAARQACEWLGGIAELSRVPAPRAPHGK
ncbi:hypothetical protein ACUXKL_001063 [Kocuria marina]|nr:MULTISPECIES: hypothetical protein [Kocuria]MCT2021276.1 hypothetical protein [Kocuria marina]